MKVKIKTIKIPAKKNYPQGNVELEIMAIRANCNKFAWKFKTNSMRLVVDLGNSYFKAAFFDDTSLSAMLSCHKDEVSKFTEFLASHEYHSAIVSTVDDVPRFLEKIIEEGNNWHLLTSGSKIPIQVDYTTPGTQGSDRLALAVAAFDRFPGQHCLVIDAGTCITYDFINKDGVYQGGAISPGINMRFKALHNFTGKLPEIEFDPGFHGLIGSSTRSSILSGVQNGVLFELSSAIQQYSERYPNLNVIISGGNANYLAKMLKNTTFAEPNFLLFGLYKILLVNE